MIVLKKHTFVMIRYSVLSKTSSWGLNKENSFEDYKSKLFAASRLEKRERIFKTITLPSIASFPKDSFTVLLFVSEDMPHKYYHSLVELVKPFDNIFLVKLNYMDHINSQMNREVKSRVRNIGGDVVYSTVRLDDDDALSLEYPNLLDSYLDRRFSGYCVSFSYGSAVIVNDEKLSEFYLRYKPKTAIGIAWINCYISGTDSFEHKEISIYSLGNHMKVDENYPTIIDPRECVWIRTVHDESDLFDADMPDKYRKTKKTDKEYLKKFFVFNEETVDE